MPTFRSSIRIAASPSKCGIVKIPRVPAASTASFSTRSSKRTATTGCHGGVSSPNRLRSAFEYSRSHANVFPATARDFFPRESSSVTSGSPRAIRETSSRVATSAEGHALGGARRLRVGQAHHPERVEQSNQPSQERDDERHLE